VRPDEEGRMLCLKLSLRQTCQGQLTSPSTPSRMREAEEGRYLLESAELKLWECSVFDGGGLCPGIGAVRLGAGTADHLTQC
jgi:hypothetical protein